MKKFLSVLVLKKGEKQQISDRNFQFKCLRGAAGEEEQ